MNTEYRSPTEIHVNLDAMITKKVMELLEAENYFIIVCPDKELLRELRGYMSDGGGEWEILDTLQVHLEDIRNEAGEYVGIRILHRDGTCEDCTVEEDDSNVE